MLSNWKFYFWRLCRITISVFCLIEWNVCWSELRDCRCCEFASNCAYGVDFLAWLLRGDVDGLLVIVLVCYHHYFAARSDDADQVVAPLVALAVVAPVEWDVVVVRHIVVVVVEGSVNFVEDCYGAVEEYVVANIEQAGKVRELWREHEQEHMVYWNVEHAYVIVEHWYLHEHETVEQMRIVEQLVPEFVHEVEIVEK